MPDEPRRRMSRHIRLVLLGGVPGLLGCAGCCGCGGTTTTAPPAEQMEEVEEIDADPPPGGPDHLIGAPFIAWWAMSHPPIVTYRLVPRTAIQGGGYTRSSSGYYTRTYYGGRSGYLSRGYGGSYGGRPAGSSGVVRGGFGSTGHATAAGA